MNRYLIKFEYRPRRSFHLIFVASNPVHTAGICRRGRIIICSMHQLFGFRRKERYTFHHRIIRPRRSPRCVGVVIPNGLIPAIISASIVHRVASLLPSSHGRMLPEADRIADRTGFQAPSGCCLFQLFGDVMPETLFAVRPDTETYGMQCSVERQVNTSYPVFPHIRYTFIAARLPPVGRECRSLRSIFRHFGCGAVPGMGNMLFRVRR